jgi:hypothetical protein
VQIGAEIQHDRLAALPGRVLNTNFDMAIKAPVLPAETTPWARPSRTASMARRMEELRPVLSAAEGLSSLSTTSSV